MNQQTTIKRTVMAKAVCLAGLLLGASQAAALSFDLDEAGEWVLDWDTIISYSAQWRVAKQDDDKFAYRDTAGGGTFNFTDGVSVLFEVHDHSLPTTEINESTKSFWSHKPLARPDVPKVEDKDWAANPVDAFIFARLARNGLRPNPPANLPTATSNGALASFALARNRASSFN